jgi:hypothetical protein
VGDFIEDKNAVIPVRVYPERPACRPAQGRRSRPTSRRRSPANASGRSRARRCGSSSIRAGRGRCAASWISSEAETGTSSTRLRP